MRRSWMPLLACLALAGCLVPESSSERQASKAEVARKTAPPPDLADLRDNPIPPVSAEPAWKDLLQHTRLLAPARALHPAPSPDGKRLAYATSEFGPRYQVVIRDVDAATPVRLTVNSGDNLFPRISPCGRLVAYASNRDGNWDLYLASIDAPAVATQVTLDPSDDVCPSWSPDGKRLAYCSRSGEGPWQIVLVDVASRIKTYLGGGLYPDWSPDPKEPRIAFQSQPRDPSGRSGVWIVNPDGTGLREVAGDSARTWSAVQPRFSPDGRWIAFSSVHRSPEARLTGALTEADDLWIVRPDGSFEMRLTEETSGEAWPAWGGDRVFFSSTRDGAANLYSLKVKPLEDRP